MSKTAQIVSGMGLAMKFITDLVQAIHEVGGNPEDVHRVVTPNGKDTLKKLAATVAQDAVVARAMEVVVDYSSVAPDMKLIEQLFSKGKIQLHEAFSDIRGKLRSCKWFTRVQNERKPVKFVVFGAECRGMTSQEILNFFQKLNCSDTNLQELLHFAAEHPEFPAKGQSIVPLYERCTRDYVPEHCDLAYERNPPMLDLETNWLLTCNMGGQRSLDTFNRVVSRPATEPWTGNELFLARVND